MERRDFEETVRGEVEKIESAARLCLQQAQVKKRCHRSCHPHTVRTTEVPLVQSTFRTLFPNAAIA